jgi:hypothetical protein
MLRFCNSLLALPCSRRNMPDFGAVVETKQASTNKRSCRWRPKISGNETMQPHTTSQQNPVATRLRHVVYLYAVINIAVVALLFSTVSPTLATGPAQEMASLR